MSLVREVNLDADVVGWVVGCSEWQLGLMWKQENGDLMLSLGLTFCTK